LEINVLEFNRRSVSVKVTKIPTNTRMFRVDQEFERVRVFKYSTITDYNNTSTEIKENYNGKPNQLWPKETTGLTILKQTD
jgi:hypothetical protein